MTPAAPSRKRNPVAKAGKEASEGTIRVAKCIVAVPAPKSKTLAAQDPEEDLELGPPCSGRCGHCHHHPCRLHGGI